MDTQVHTGRTQGEENKPAKEPGRGHGGVESMEIWGLEAMQKARQGQLEEKCGKTGGTRVRGKKSKRKQNGIRAGKEACWREGVRGRAGKLILNMENRRGG